MIKSKLRNYAQSIMLDHASRRKFGSYSFYHWANRYVSYYDGLIDDLNFNGEGYILEKLGPYIETAFDVGANRGAYLGALRRHAPAAAIHAFEIVPETFSILEKRFPCEPYLNCLGLSDTDGGDFCWFEHGKSNLATLTSVTSSPLPDSMAAKKSQYRFVVATPIVEKMI